MSSDQIGCETCLKLQREHSAVLRLYADAVEQRAEALAQGNFKSDTEATISSAYWVCSEARLLVERHESRAHSKARSAIR